MLQIINIKEIPEQSSKEYDNDTLADYQSNQYLILSKKAQDNAFPGSKKNIETLLNSNT
jgi:hypothetical protein